MNTFTNRVSKLFCFLITAGLSFSALAFNDGYPKNPKVDALNYIFKIELSDDTDMITCEVTVDIRLLEVV